MKRQRVLVIILVGVIIAAVWYFAATRLTIEDDLEGLESSGDSFAESTSNNKPPEEQSIVRVLENLSIFFEHKTFEQTRIQGGQTQMFTPPQEEILGATIVRAGQYFPVKWAVDYRANVPICNPRGCFDGVVAQIIEEESSIVAFDIDFVNNRSDRAVAVNLSNQFRLEYQGRFIAPLIPFGGIDTAIHYVEPLSSIRQTVVFKVPKTVSEVSLLYGSNIAEIVGGFSIDFSKKTIKPLKG